jgi:hypothetical protein
MLPVFWTALPSLPKTVSGKVDYKALPRPEHLAQPLRRPPQGPTELAIANIWMSLLDRSAIERDESFFSAGGHSLLAMRALARMNGALGATLSLAAFFKEPTIQGLAAEIARTPAAERRLEPDPVEEHVDPKELAEIRAQLADLSDDEVEALLLQALEGE